MSEVSNLIFMEGKILAIDYGRKRVGIATGDLSVKIAFPRVVIQNKNLDFLLCSIVDLCHEVDAKTVIVGWPLNMNPGEVDNNMMKEVKIFFNKLVVLLKPEGRQVLLIDERLSSFEAESLLRNSDISSRDSRKQSDAVAAQIILQRFFDSLTT